MLTRCFQSMLSNAAPVFAVATLFKVLDGGPELMALACIFKTFLKPRKKSSSI